MELIFAICLSAVTAIAGAYISRKNCERRHEMELGNLDFQMTEELKGSYQTYCELEQRVIKIITAMRHKDIEFSRKLNVQRENILGLQAALECHEQSRKPEQVIALSTEAELELAFQQALEPISAAFDGSEIFDLPDDAEELNYLFDDIDREAQRSEEQQLGAVDEQTRFIQSLTSRTQDLQPLAQSLAERDQEIRKLKSLYASLTQTNQNQIQLLTDCLAEFQPYASKFDGEQDLVQRWQSQLAESEGSLKARIQEQAARIEQLEPQAIALKSTRQELRATCEQREQMKSKLEATQGQLDDTLSQLDDACAELEQARCTVAEQKLEMQRLSQLVQERDELVQQMTPLTQAVQNLKIQVTGLESELEDVLTKHEFDCTELEDMRLKHDFDCTELENKSARIKQLESDGRANADSLQELENELLEKDRCLTEMQHSLETSRCEFDEFKSASANENKAFEARSNDLQNELREARAELQSSLEAHQQMERRINELGDELIQVRTQLQTREQEFTSVDTQLNSQINELEERALCLQSELQDREALLEERNAHISHLERKVSNQAENLFNLEEVLQKQAQELNGRETELQKRAGEAQELQSMLNEIEAAKRDLELELASTAQAVNSKETRISELMGALDQVSGEAESTRRDVMHKVSTFREAQSMLEALRPMLEGLETTLKKEAVVADRGDAKQQG